MDIDKIVQTIRKEGRVVLKEGHGTSIELVAEENWDPGVDSQEGIVLLFDLFQIRSIALPFSEVSLDIVELASKPVIYRTPANPFLKATPVVEGKIRFSMIREGNWNKLLFNFGKPLIYQLAKSPGSEEMVSKDKFPLLAEGVKEMFLGPEGEVKMYK